MPRAALASTIVDWILPLDMIGPRLVEIVEPTGQDTAPRLVAPESPRGEELTWQWTPMP